MGHIEAMPVNGLVEVLAAILAHAETADRSFGIASEQLQRTAVFTLASKIHHLPPIFGRLRRILTAIKKEYACVSPESLELIIVRKVLRRMLV